MVTSSIITSPPHTTWLTDTHTPFTIASGETVNVIEFKHQPNQAILSAWAKHFRSHYCDDAHIDALREKKTSRADYLKNIVFPDKLNRLGRGVLSGDFAEILVADYLEYALSYWVPRIRWDSKINRNSSPQGSDVVAFRIIDEQEESEDDTLKIVEVKAQLSGTRANNRLQDAVDSSIHDYTRIGESLNAIKRRFVIERRQKEADIVDRFQNMGDRPFTMVFGAVAVYSSTLYNEAKNKSKLQPTNISSHPYKDDLSLLLIHGADLMKLAHELYERAANEA